MKSPLVTVVTPTYNRAYILGNAIQSVLSQTYPHFEYIIVDDGSVDATADVVASFADPRIKYLRNKTNKGLSAARNKALGSARGQWVTYIDDDNELFPNHLEVMMRNVYGRDDVVFVISRGMRTLELYKDGEMVQEIDDFANFPEKMTPKDIALKKFYFDNNGFVHSRRVIDDGIRFDEASVLGTLEDWEFAIQLCEKYPSGLLYIKDVLFHYHQRFGTDGRVSNDTYANVARAFEYIYQKHKNDEILEGQTWYPQRVEKYRKLQKDFEKGLAPPKYLLPFVRV